METDLLPKLAESGATFLLLGYVVFHLVTLLKSVADSLIQLLREMSTGFREMTDRLVASNADLSASLRAGEAARSEAIAAHQEQLLVMKIIAERLAEKEHG